MREIIFRGKRTDNGEWVYGWPFADTADCSLKKAGKCVCPHDGSEYFIVEWVDDYHEYEERQVIPNTVCQYTGLKDKHGKRIFEGDILSLRTGRTYVVKFEDGAFILEDSAIPMRFANKFEVIGNIHDNPELIKEEKA